MYKDFIEYEARSKKWIIPFSVYNLTFPIKFKVFGGVIFVLVEVLKELWSLWVVVEVKHVCNLAQKTIKM